MKPKLGYFRSTPLFGTSLRCGVPAFVGFTVLISGLSAHAGDLLRGGRTGSNMPGAPAAASAAGGATPAATDAARANALDTLARTTRTLDAVRAMQTAARNAAITGANSLGNHPANQALALPAVPNGLTSGGLVVAPVVATDPRQWSGAQPPTQTLAADGSTQVTVKQTAQQALLNWQTFNVGKQTTLTFDQSAGGENVSQWIAFNKVSDATANPTQILGSIKAAGQVYLINPNGVIFGGSSQVNARNLTVSSLPINDNLVSQGLLNNRDAQFLFSGLSVPGGADGTPNFIPDPPSSGGRYGDVTVQAGALLESPAGSGGNGGRILLVGPNVTNAGTLATESGQTVLAAGLQVAVAAHNGSDPSLRGLDVWVGALGDGAGTVTNSGIIDILTGSAWLSGGQLDQLGVINSSTSVNLNGRIDLIASYGAVANPNFDSSTEQGSGGPMFFNQYTGTLTLGEGSVSQILPDYASTKTVPGIALPERSQVNLDGLAIHLDKSSILLAPNGEVMARAGVWPYKDADGSRTIFDTGGAVESGITNFYSGTTQKFLLDGGQIYADESATINVAGSGDVFVPLAQNILTVQLRGAELADSALQRDSNLRGRSLTVDIRDTGTYNGKFWMGTPLGDVTGLAGLIERNAAQLTAVGGNITLQAGGSIVLRDGASLDVSGGSFRHEAGMVKTSWLVSGGRLVAIKDATPDQVYDGVFNAQSVFVQNKWGIVEAYTSPFYAGTYQESYVEGAAGGTLSLSASSMVLDGDLRGATVTGPQQRSDPPAPSSLKIDFEADKAVAVPESTGISYIKHSPTPPAVWFATNAEAGTVPEFVLVDGAPVALPAERIETVVLSPELLAEEGFASLEVINPDGSITVPENVTLATAPEGCIRLSAANLSVFGSLVAPSGKLVFTTYNIAPSFASEYAILNPTGSTPFPSPAAGRGLFLLGGSARLSAAGLIADDRPASGSAIQEAVSTAGGEIAIQSYQASLERNSLIDVSGGVYVSEKGANTYGKAGTISLSTGSDAGFAGVIGGGITLGSTLRGYSGSTGGTLNIQASLIEIGGANTPGPLHLGEDFFRQGGFTKYSLTGIGARSTEPPPSGQFESYIPAISIAADAKINPLAESFIAEENSARPGTIALNTFIRPDGLRSAVSMSFTALGSDDPFTLDQLEVRGDMVMGMGSTIVTEPGASVSFKAGTVTLLGSVTTPGGKISIAGASSFPVTAAQRLSITQALPTVHIGKAAQLSVAGTTLLKPDPYGRRVGTVFGGGSIFISGNILAAKGSLLDASGASGILDLDPAALAASSVSIGNDPQAGLTAPPIQFQSVATRIDSTGGMIDLAGSQMLLSDATLRGGAGGSAATGGKLLVSSGQYYRDGDGRTGADTNLVVTQSGDVILNPDASMGVGIGLFDDTGIGYGNLGAFSIDRFSEGSFASLSLGGKYFANASPIPYGGNVAFNGNIDLQVSGELRLAAGGVITANDTVNISASYLAIGQDFRAPQHPDDAFLPFQRDPAFPTNLLNFAPTYGTGSLAFNAQLIDVGTLSLQNIGRVNLDAGSGDIRGNGTLSIAGDLTLNAAKIYPTSLSSFSIFAYDHLSGTGSVTIHSPGGTEIPLSAGGSLSVYASSIHQGGILRAPLGTINLGWDGTDLDPSDSAIDSPYNVIAGTTVASPVSKDLTLVESSVTSVSAATQAGTPAWISPFGNSPDGQAWIDPRGVNVTLAGLPEKSISIAGESVNLQAGAVVDISGGGDLLASRWVAGNGGSMDLLGSASAAWGGGIGYQPGDLVVFNGATWSARVRHTGQTPLIGLYWSKVAESYAIIPASSLAFAPYNAFNSGSNAQSLAGDPGYVSSGLGVGDTITLAASNGLPAGTYTLLPRRYALLPGAFLITPQSGIGNGQAVSPDGSVLVSGFIGNRFIQPASAPLGVSRFEIASAEVIGNRVSYETYSADGFLGEIADKLETGSPQQLPQDSGYAAFHGNSALWLDGILRSEAAGLGARVDISSFAGIRLTSGVNTAGGIVLQTSILSSWGADSLLIGGIRRSNIDGATTIETRTANLTLDNSGGNLSAADVILVSTESLTIANDSSLTASGDSEFEAKTLSLIGDGTLLRVGMDAGASILRTGVCGSTGALLSIGSSVNLSGESIILDSTYGTDLASDLNLGADHLTLGSGQISVVFGNASGTLDGAVIAPHLVLKGSTLDKVLQARDLTLQSYRSIDFYGSGVLGGAGLERMSFIGSGLRGYETSAAAVVIRATDVAFNNSVGASVLTLPTGASGSLRIDAENIRLGANAFAVAGYQDVSLEAAKGVFAQGRGSFFTTGNLLAETPLITGDAGASYAITAAQAMVLERGTGTAICANSLGTSLTFQAATVTANTNIFLPSGQLTLRATHGDVKVGGGLSVAGSSKTFNDLTRHANAGSITLESLSGDVVLADGAAVSVAAAPGGGKAGTLNVKASQGSFLNSASVNGQAARNSTSGSFTLDTGFLPSSGSGSLADLDASLDLGGFSASRSFRIRRGDVSINHTVRSAEFSLAADQGNIDITGEIDASGKTGGRISLAARGNLVLAAGAKLSVAALEFDNAGKGGSILLEAGTQRDGAANTAALLELRAGASIDLSVGEYLAGRYDQPGSSAFQGEFTGTLHLRAPRTATNGGLGISSIQSTITGASAVIAEGFKVYEPAGGVMNIALRNQIHADGTAFIGAAGAGNANETAIRSNLLNGAAEPSSLGSLLVVAPGVEIVNSHGDLVVGLANHTSSGSTDQESLAAADWDLSGLRYGSRSAAGVLTLRAEGDLVFNNTLSDGFDPIAQGSTQVFADNGHSLMWLASLTKISETLPVNTQSWSYRLSAGADTDASNFRSVLSSNDLDLQQPGKGSVIVGEFYPAVPNTLATGTAAGIGTNGQTADTIRISSSTTNRGNRFEVIRTGTGGITVSAGRDVQLRNPFSTIYTAGVALPTLTSVFSEGDFVLPVIPTTVNRHPSQSGGSLTLGAVQQIYQSNWSLAGGSIAISAQSNIGRYALMDGVIKADSSRQMPTNWLYRRGYVDSSTGLFASDGGFGTNPNPSFQNAENVTDVATSTAWWIDYSNFFQGIGTLGGGNIDLTAGGDIVNLDAVAPTNARMAGRGMNAAFGVVADAPEYLSVAPDADRLLEHGGGDVVISAGRNIDGGIYYVEKGNAILRAGGSVTTNEARSPSLGLLDGSAPLDPLTWMPTTLFVGKSQFEVTARGDILLGPVTNPFLLPQGLNNKYWYKTTFSTFSADAGVTASSYGGSVTHRMEINLPDGASSRSILDVWFSNQNLYNGVSSAGNASHYQPWLRLNAMDLQTYNGVFSVMAPNVRSTAFAGDINLVGSWTQAPSCGGDLELAAAGSVVGLHQTGPGRINNRDVQVWTSAKITLSDASLTSIPGIESPLAYQSAIGRDRPAAVQSKVDILQKVNLSLAETGSYRDLAGITLVKQALHGDGILHLDDLNPVRIFATGGDITGFTLFSPKQSLVMAQRDITDVGLYLQNVRKTDVTVVSAGRDIIPFNEKASLRSLAGNPASGNFVGDGLVTTVTGDSTNAMAGDIQINGPGVLEVLSGRNLDLGTGANFFDGTGVGITSIGNIRNPNLPFAGADIIVLAGVTAPSGNGPALGLALGSMTIAAFITSYLQEPEKFDSTYWTNLGKELGFDDLTAEQQAIVALEKYYAVLRDAGRQASSTGSYDAGSAAVTVLFGAAKPLGGILTRAREIRTTSSGAISLGVPGGGITMASEVFGNPLTPPGIVTEYGGAISTFTNGSVDIGQARIFTLRGGDITMWSSAGNIAAGSSPRTVVTAPPTRVLIDITSADVQTDLGGLATGGGIGVLAAVEGVNPGNVDLIAPKGYVDAGDAGIRVTGNLNIAAQVVLNTSNISAGGTSTGAALSAPAAPSVTTVTSASNAGAAATTTNKLAEQAPQDPPKPEEEVASFYTVEVIGYGGGFADEEEEGEAKEKAAPGADVNSQAPEP